jgi:hypothetical protein
MYTVTADPARPTCIWVNSDSGSGQIQNLDAYTGGACGQGPIRVLASSFVVDTQLCQPASYTSLQITSPARNTYTSGTVDFEDADANPISGLPTVSLDSTGTASLSGLNLTTAYSLPQFLITLTGASSTPASVTATLTWTGTDDPSCLKPGTTTTGSTTATCPSIKFFGVRGSGETDAYGIPIGAFAAELAYRLHQAGVSYSAEPIDYPAIAVLYAAQEYGTAYKNSVTSGENQLETALILFWHDCPGHKVILAGYSQGAHVVGDIADNLKPGYRKLVAAVALFGDPRFNPDQRQVDVGTYQHYYGVYEFYAHPRVVPGDLYGKFRSVCSVGDPVCNFTSGNLTACAIQGTSCPHLQYNGWARTEADWAAGKV